MNSYFVMFFILLSIITFGISAPEYAEARGFNAFSFSLADETAYNDLSFYVDGSKPNLVVEKGEMAAYPIVINSKTDESTTVNFHTTIGNDQMGEVRLPLGVDIQLNPNPIVLEGNDQMLNVTVHVSDNAPSNKYNVNIVGVWNTEENISDFLGSSFSLHVGRDFGDDAVPVNFFQSPLKYYKDGATPEEIVCRNGMILVLKNNDIPACVQDETKPILIKRGWMKTQVNVFDESQFIESTKNLDAVELFLSLHPNATITVDSERFTVHYKESGFREHSTSRVTQHTKDLTIGLDYTGKPFAQGITCGGPVSISTSNITKLNDPDWCFSLDQTGFSDEQESKTELISKTSDDFAFAFYSEIAEEDKQSNIFFSPLSISTAFSIAHEGAKEETKSQFQQVFDFEKDDSKRHKKISDTLSRLNHEDDLYDLQIANALWIKDGYKIKQDYIDIARMHYSSTVENVDFATDDGIAKINGWVQEKTNEKIENILGPGSTDEFTRMVITNAVYFKGKWGLQFNPDRTTDQPFWTDKENSVTVPMMSQSVDMYNYVETKDLQSLELNYLGGDISMILLLPNEIGGIQSLEQTIDSNMLNSIKDSMIREPVTVKMPKFEFETEYDLVSPLKSLGIHDAFDERKADFEGMTDEQVYIDQATHKAFVNVNEEGTEAAAITALVIRPTSGPPDPKHEFIADHPFMFVIQEKNTNEILFIGKLANPQVENED